ncbi:iron ABC transporter permease [Georgenia halophila]|uniref:Iron ABC transporter permease n=1 Tax=Georgenia halophila TaxID=620889 RepID=A0ABP8LJS9_9MICO
MIRRRGVSLDPTVQRGPTALRGRRGRRPSGFAIVSGVLAVAFAVLAIYPLSAVAVRAFFPGGQLNATVWEEVFAEPDLGQVLLNTLLVIVGSGGVAIVVGSVLAWINERTDAKLGLFSDALPMLPFLLPPIAGAIGWVLLLSPNAGLLNAMIRTAASWIGIDISSGPLDIYTWYGLLLVYGIYQVPLVFMMVSAGLRNLDASLEEQSRVCGTGPFKALFKVTLPALWPSIAGAGLLTTWTALGLYSVPAVIGTGARIDVLTTRIVNGLAFSYPPKYDVAIGLSVFMLGFVAIIWWIQTRVLRRNQHAAMGGKGQRATAVRLGRWRRPVQVGVVLYAVVTTVLPMCALIIVSLNGYWTSNIDWGGLSLDALRLAVFENVRTRTALENSLLLGVVGATVGILLAAVISLYISRARPRVGRAVDGAVKLPSTLANVVIAVGFVLAFAGPPIDLGGTILILFLAYLALYLPNGIVATDSAVAQIGRELPEASALSGAGELRTFLRIYLPLMLPGMIVGWALLFVRMVGDLTASAILAGTTNPVVGRQILETYQNGSFSLLAALATVLTVISTVVVVGVMVLSRSSSRWGKTARRVNTR